MRGLLVMGHEARSLQPCNDDRTLWVSARGALQQQLTAAVHQLTTRPYKEVCFVSRIHGLVQAQATFQVHDIELFPGFLVT